MRGLSSPGGSRISNHLPRTGQYGRSQSSLILNPDEKTQFRLPLGKRIGVYEILEEIALGGTGAAY
jgi:hypothetical protein